MPKNRRRTRNQQSRASASIERTETRAGEAVTIAWTSSVTGAFVADIVVIAAHLYSRANPDAQAARAFEAIMLLTAATMGAISLLLLLAVWRTRRLKPPRGYTIFATLIAAAPIAALLARLFG